MWSIIAVLGQFIPGLFGKKLAFGTAKIVGIGIAVVLLIVLLSMGKCAYDKSIINDHETERRADSAEAAVDAERVADEKEAKRLEEAEAEADRLNEEAAKAKVADPAGAAKKVGPVTGSYYDNIPEKKGSR